MLINFFFSFSSALFFFFFSVFLRHSFPQFTFSTLTVMTSFTFHHIKILLTQEVRTEGEQLGESPFRSGEGRWLLLIN
jgi:hypothetical protein